MVQRAAARISSGKQLHRLWSRTLGRHVYGLSRLVEELDFCVNAAAVEHGRCYSSTAGWKEILVWKNWTSVQELSSADSRIKLPAFKGRSGGAKSWELFPGASSVGDWKEDNVEQAAEKSLKFSEDGDKEVIPPGMLFVNVRNFGGYVLSSAKNYSLFRTQGHRIPLQLMFKGLREFSSDGADGQKDQEPLPESHVHSQRAVVTALWCNFLVFSLKVGVWMYTASHVMLAEAVHSLADLANQGLLAYGLVSSRRAPDALHPCALTPFSRYGYQKERFVWSLISAVGIFCLGSGATIVHGVQHLWDSQPLENVGIAAAVIVGSLLMEGASLLVALSSVRKGAAAAGMTLKEYLWRGHDPTSVAVLMEDGAAVTGLAFAAAALTATHITGNAMWDAVGSILVGNLLGVVAIFLIQMNRQALIGRSLDEQDMRRIIKMLSSQPVVDAVYDCKSELIGPGQYRFKAEIDFNGVQIVQNYLERAGRAAWIKEFRDAVDDPREGAMDRAMANYGEEVVSALGSEVDRLEKEIQLLMPGIRHVDIEAHNPKGPTPREKFHSAFIDELKK